METVKSTVDRVLDAIVLTGLAVWVILVLLLHTIQALVHDISTDAVSLYAIGDFGFLMMAAFAGLGLAHLALAAQLRRHLGLWFGPSLLALVGLCALASGIFETDPKDADPLSTHGLIHLQIGLVSFVVMALTPLVFAASLRRIRGWGRVTRASLALGIGTVAAFLAMPLAFRDAYFGIGQRIFIAIYLSWLFVMALAIARRPRVVATTAGATNGQPARS